MDRLWGAVPYAAALVVLGLVVILLFHPHIGRLIDRIRKVGPLEAPPQTPEPTPPVLPGPQRQDDSPVIGEFATRIETELDRRGMQAGINQGRYNELLRLAAYGQMMVVFERAASQIYASQLTLLKAARAGGNRIDGARARATFDRALAQFSDAHGNTTYLQWIGFLESFEFVARGGSGDVQLTERGVQFLLFFPATGRAEPDRL